MPSRTSCPPDGDCPKPPSTDSPTLVVSLLGPLSVCWDGQPIAALGSGKLAALLVYLLLEAGPVRREMLADLLFPDVTGEAARLSLRQLVFQLRAQLCNATGREFLLADRHSLAFDSHSPHCLSLAQFIAPLPLCVGLSTAECSPCLRRLAGQAELYLGRLLDGFALDGCPDFEDWLQGKREAMHRHALDLLTRLVDCHEQRGNYRAALVFAQRLVAIEPLSEVGQLRLMRLYAQDHRLDAALAQYESCRRTLEDQLGVAPSAALRAFARQLQQEGLKLGGDPLSGGAPLADEKRQVTVLYCELRAEEADEANDPEGLLNLLQTRQSRLAGMVRQQGGHIVQSYSGGLLAYFGYPQALENAALQAVRAALALAAQSKSQLPLLAVRVGVHSGLVVASPSTGVPDMVGATSRIAIGLREYARPGEVVVSSATQRRTAGYFRFAETSVCRRQALSKGGAAFRVVAESGARHRLAAAARLTPFAGRQAESAALSCAWAQVQGGEFQVRLLCGEAGIGKSRLVDALVHQVEQESGTVRELRCFPETRQSPLYPLVALLENLCGFKAGDDCATKLAELERLLRLRVPQLAASGLPILACLLGLAPDDPNAVAGESAERLYSAGIELFIGLLQASAARQPVLLVIEDLHWADASTLDLVSVVIERHARWPVLMVLTARSDWYEVSGLAWPPRIVLDVPPLATGEIRSMVAALAPELAPQQVERLVALAEGVPLFAEELAIMMAHAPADEDLPANLHDLLMARLDRLGPARPVAQLAATIGREFDLELLGLAGELSPGSLRQATERLLASGLVREMADQQLQFKHALVQQAAYRSQTRAARQAAHRQVAQALERHYSLCGKAHPELLAQHWGAAGEALRAADYWLRAGQQAAGRFAHREAVAHFEAGLVALLNVAQDPARDQLEFGLKLGMAQSEQVVCGYGSSRSAELLHAAGVLAGLGTGNSQALFRVVWGLWEGAGSRTDHGEAVRQARRLLEIAAAVESSASDLLAQAHYALGNSLFWTGEFGEARRHLEIALTMIDPQANPPLRDCYGCIVVVGIKVYWSWVCWMQGGSEAAGVASSEVLALARDYDDGYSLAFALTFAATLQRWQGDVAASAALAAEGLREAQRSEAAVFAAALTVTLGWVEVMRGKPEAIVRIEEGINAIRQAMSAVVVSLLAPFAEALLHLGQAGKALPIIDEALEQAAAKHDRHYLAELHRLKGVCQQAAGRCNEAQMSFELAAELAQAQGAVVFAERVRQCRLACPA
jgi:DNA-binding SARP family transcriptional activator